MPLELNMRYDEPWDPDDPETPVLTTRVRFAFRGEALSIEITADDVDDDAQLRRSGIFAGVVLDPEDVKSLIAYLGG